MEKQCCFALKSFENIQELIRLIDQKSGAVLLVSGLILTAFLELSKDLVFNFKSLSYVGVATFMFGAITALLLISTIYLSVFKILRPRLAEHYSGNEFSLIYFNHLAAMTDKAIMFLISKMLQLGEATVMA